MFCFCFFFFGHIFNLGTIFENFDQKCQKVIFWQKIMFFAFFSQNFQI